ncbi:MAG TPA: hypothetical protein VNA25_23810 [Phycisphaerae bacterium]|nr:hypothetical protein [Phycisphaerae bacterium]
MSTSDTLEFPVVSGDMFIQARYEMMREDGQSHNIAEMCAFQEFPGVETESTFNEGISETDGFDMGSPFDRALFQKYKKHAQKAGIPTGNCRYYAQVARFPGDPLAWVKSKDEVKDRCRRNGWAARGGGVDCDFRGDIIDDEKASIDPKLVKDHTNQEILRIHADQVPTGKVTVSKGEYEKVYADQYTKMNKGYE